MVYNGILIETIGISVMVSIVFFSRVSKVISYFLWSNAML